jgi:hypothetical protein
MFPSDAGRREMEPRQRAGAEMAKFAAFQVKNAAGLVSRFHGKRVIAILHARVMTNPVPVPPLFGQNNFEPARTICRGTIRLLHSMGYSATVELPLPSGRRADIAAVGPSGEIWIVEVKSCLNDFRTDQKWEDYRAHCDRLFFAVDCDFPQDVIPDEAGLMVVDGYGGAILREAMPHPLAAATRKAVMLRIARISSSRLSALNDPKIQAELF